MCFWRPRHLRPENSLVMIEEKAVFTVHLNTHRVKIRVNTNFMALNCMNHLFIPQIFSTTLSGLNSLHVHHIFRMTLSSVDNCCVCYLYQVFSTDVNDRCDRPIPR